MATISSEEFVTCDMQLLPDTGDPLPGFINKAFHFHKFRDIFLYNFLARDSGNNLGGRNPVTGRDFPHRFGVQGPERYRVDSKRCVIGGDRPHISLCCIARSSRIMTMQKLI